MSDISIKIAIAEPSSIIRSGIAVTLKRIHGFHAQTFEIASPDLLLGSLKLYKPDLLIVNPIYWIHLDLNKLKEEAEILTLKTMAIVTGMYDETITSRFNDVIGLYDTIEQLQQKFENIFNVPDSEEATEENETLSLREKEILTCVVKGHTNKEIASELFLSTHTVITHRRNIARKLGIHSAAGLTIYAIVNKLVDIRDVNPTD
jgi:DNA-binding CsgD family transcriptional regulator